MPFAPTKIFTMDRRHLLKLTGAMGIGATFVNPEELYAAGQCDHVFVDNGDVKATQAGATLQFWIDGMHFGSRSDLASRANITLFMDLKQDPNIGFVESVVLMDGNKKTMGARYFDASMKMTDGHVPYVRFENVTLDPAGTYYIVYTVKQGSNVKLYTSTLSNPKVSTLNTTFLPQFMRNDFQTFLVGNTVNPTPGLITTQFQFYTLNGLSAHTARGHVTDIGSDGSFNVNIAFMHGDAAADHYMRYFIVMDPVGRLLGYHKRSFGDPDNNGGASQTWNVTHNDLSNVPSDQIADIRDCPYIQFYTEDSYDAIARNMIRLR